MAGGTRSRSREQLRGTRSIPAALTLLQGRTEGLKTAQEVPKRKAARCVSARGVNNANSAG